MTWCRVDVARKVQSLDLDPTSLDRRHLRWVTLVVQVVHRTLRQPGTSLVATPPLDPHKAGPLTRVAVPVTGIILPVLGEILEILVLMPGGLEFGHVPPDTASKRGVWLFFQLLSWKSTPSSCLSRFR